MKIFSREAAHKGQRDIDPHVTENFGELSIERNFSGLRFDGIKNATSIEKMKNIFI